MKLPDTSPKKDRFALRPLKKAEKSTITKDKKKPDTATMMAI